MEYIFYKLAGCPTVPFGLEVLEIKTKDQYFINLGEKWMPCSKDLFEQATGHTELNFIETGLLKSNLLTIEAKTS